MMFMDVDTALSEVPVNTVPLTDDTDFKTVEEAVAYNASGLELIWHFTTTAGATTATVVTPTTGGAYDWAHQDGGMYTIEIPASGGASINNDTEGFGYFTGKATGVLPWRGPTICFRAAALNNALIDSAWSTTRGLAGTALPDAAADAAGGLIISDAGGFDIDNRAPSATSISNMNIVYTTDFATNYSTTADMWNGNLTKINGDPNPAVGLYNAGTHYYTYLHFDTDQNLLSSAITTVNSQTEFVLAEGLTTDDVYNGMMLVITGVAQAERWVTRVTDYVGATKTITIAEAAPWTVDTADEVNIITVPDQVNALPTATAGAAGGVFIAGTNAATTVTTSFTTTFTGNLTGGINTGSGTITTLDGLDTAQDTQHTTTQNYLSTNLGLLGANATEAGGTGDHLTGIPWNAAWDAEVQSEVADALGVFWTSPATLVDLVWDEVITGAAHNVNTSAAKFLRESAQSTTGVTGTLQSATSTTAVLASGAVTNDDIFNGERIAILEGTGAGQSRLIFDSVASTDTVELAHAWTVTPDNTSIYGIVGAEADVRAVAEHAVTATSTVDFDDLATTQADLDILTGSDGATLATTQPNYAPAKVSDLGTVQTGDTYALANGANGFVATKAVVDAIPTLAEILAGGDIDGYTLEETLKLCLAALAGKLSGAATTTVTIRAADDSKDRITATVDADGVRSAVTLDATG